MTKKQYSIWNVNVGIDLIDLRKKLEQLQPGKAPQDPTHLIEELLSATLPAFERDLKGMQENLTEAPPALPPPALPPIRQAIRHAEVYGYPGSRPRHLCGAPRNWAAL